MLKKVYCVMLVMLLIVMVLPVNSMANTVPGDMARSGQTVSYETVRGKKGTTTVTGYTFAMNGSANVNDRFVLTVNSLQPGTIANEGTIYWVSPSGYRYDDNIAYDTKSLSLTVYADNVNATEGQGQFDYGSTDYGTRSSGTIEATF